MAFLIQNVSGFGGLDLDATAAAPDYIGSFQVPAHHLRLLDLAMIFGRRHRRAHLKA